MQIRHTPRVFQIRNSYKLKKTVLLFVSSIIFIISAFTGIFISTWAIQSDYIIKFSGSGAEGTFQNLSGKINFDENSFQNSLIDVSVDANTIQTGSETKNSHAKDEDWLDVKKYPKIKFKSDAFSKSGDKYLMTGTLELHGIAKKLIIPFSFLNSENTGTFSGEFTINRKDFGINGPFFGFVAGTEVKIQLKIPVKKI